MSRMYRVKDWGEKQQYKDRNPTWIKLHRSLLGSFRFANLSLASKAVAPLLWLLASENKDPTSGLITGNHEEIAFKIHVSVEDVNQAINELIEKDYLELVQNCTELYGTVHNRSPETETETQEKTEAEQIREAAPKEKPIEKKNQAVEIIAALDISIEKHFGKEFARICPASMDYTTAQRWITAGATVDACAAVIDSVVQRQVSKGKPPSGLKYFDNPIMDALANRSAPTPNLSPAKSIELKTPPDIIAKLRRSPSITDTLIKQWFDPCSIDGTRITAPSKFIANQLEQKFGSDLTMCFGREMTITFEERKAA